MWRSKLALLWSSITCGLAKSKQGKRDGFTANFRPAQMTHVKRATRYYNQEDHPRNEVHQGDIFAQVIDHVQLTLQTVTLTCLYSLLLASATIQANVFEH